jgi:hypothetical protein
LKLTARSPLKLVLVLVTVCALCLSAASTALAAPPANDNFADAATVGPALPVSAAGTTVDATGEGIDEPDHSGEGEGPYRSVWYSFTPSASAALEIDACDSDEPTWLAVYTGAQLDELDQIAGGVFECSAGLAAQAGTTYWIAVDSFDPTAFTLSVQSSGVILDNGVIQLGVRPEGHLNVPGDNPSSGEGTTTVGLRYKPTNAESVAPGCECEGWGAADAISEVTGYANESTDSGANNMDVTSFTSTATTAVSVVEIGGTLRVTHDYHPAGTSPNLFEAEVTIENISASNVDARYRRVMDWDIEPTAFDEFSTVDVGNSARLLDNNNDGFSTADPLGADTSDPGFPLFTGTFVDAGPEDHGARFDFGFGTLAPSAEVTFHIYYGAAGNQNDAIAALDSVGAEILSLGQPNTTDGPTLGTPNTFAFGFTDVQGDPVVEAPPAPAITASDPPSGSDGNNPRIRGTARPGSTVQLYTDAACTAAIGSAAPVSVFASTGIPITVPDNSTTTLYAKATNDYGVSPCSSAFSYQEVTPPHGASTTPPKKCKKGFVKKKGKCVKKKRKKKKK